MRTTRRSLLMFTCFCMITCSLTGCQVSLSDTLATGICHKILPESVPVAFGKDQETDILICKGTDEDLYSVKKSLTWNKETVLCPANSWKDATEKSHVHPNIVGVCAQETFLGVCSTRTQLWRPNGKTIQLTVGGSPLCLNKKTGILTYYLEASDTSDSKDRHGNPSWIFHTWTTAYTFPINN